MLTKKVNGEKVILDTIEEANFINERESYLAVERENARVELINTEAQNRIISHLPSGSPENFIIKELNLLMLDNELNDILLHGGTLTPEQELQKASFRDLKDKIKLIRGLSDQAVSSGLSIDQFKSNLELESL